MKEFNTTGLCNPRKHYMVDIHQRLQNIKAMIDAGKYFCMNCARQYGKTTTLSALASYLRNEYIVVDLDFQDIGDGSFSNEGEFCKTFSRIVRKTADESGLSIPASARNSFLDLSERSPADGRMDELLSAFSEWCRCSEKPMVLMIDEVDTATNNQVFLDFLAQLRSLYLKREKGKNVNTFQSVILAGVTDVKHLKAKIRPEDDIRFNSPWNIAADFNIDMSLSEAGIKGMLDEYEADHHTGMDTSVIAKEIYDYTSGYPFLVSRICQKIDTQLDGNRFPSLHEAWTAAGVSEAVRLILTEKNTLFDSLMGKVSDHADLREILQRILFGGERIPYNPDNIPSMDGEMYGFITNRDGALSITNRIFETRLYNYFLSLSEMKETPISKEGAGKRQEFILDGRLNMERLLSHYVTVFDDLYGSKAETFGEEEGRRRFLLFIRPVINGTGNYYVEAHTRDDKRMDLVIDYLGERFVVELKIWRGKVYHEKGEVQLSEYLEACHLDTGYMLTYNFTKSKKRGVRQHTVNKKRLIEATV